MVHICADVGANGYQMAILCSLQRVINRYKDFLV